MAGSRVGNMIASSSFTTSSTKHCQIPLVQSLFEIQEDKLWAVVAVLYGALIFYVLKSKL